MIWFNRLNSVQGTRDAKLADSADLCAIRELSLMLRVTRFMPKVEDIMVR